MTFGPAVEQEILDDCIGAQEAVAAAEARRAAVFAAAREAGVSVRAIAAAVGMSQGRVRRLLRKAT